jgi:uncharacterized membrane protein
VELGPVQLLVIGFDHPNFRGEVAQELERLSDLGLVRVLDALVVAKDADGTVTKLELSQLTTAEAEELGATVGALIGLGAAGEEGALAGAELGAAAAADGHLLDDIDALDVLEEIGPGTTAAVILIEHQWSIPLRNAITRAGGAPVLDLWVHPLDLVAIGVAGAEEIV